MRFREAFGQPSTTVGQDDHWKFQASPSVMPINLLLNGTLDDAVVWLFDPHEPGDGVVAVTITREDQVAPLIREIRERVERASSAA
jgi:hypothetical protein